nr:hypothetical protein [Tanacetum cinerariifolium]
MVSIEGRGKSVVCEPVLAFNKLAGMGTEVHCKSSLEHEGNENSNSSSWPLFYGNNKALTNGHYYNGFVPRTVTDVYPGCDKEEIKQKMLEHEAIFKDQKKNVFELSKGGTVACSLPMPNRNMPEKEKEKKVLDQPEWIRHVTIVHQTKNLHTADYTQLYDFLKYNQKEVDELKAERLAKTQDPLALMENSNNPYAFLAPHQDQSS